MKYWLWIKDNLAALIVAFIAIMGAGMFWRYHRKTVASLKDDHAVQQALRRVTMLNTLRESLNKESSTYTTELKDIDKELLENKRIIVERHEYTDTLSDTEVLDELTRLGY